MMENKTGNFFRFLSRLFILSLITLLSVKSGDAQDPRGDYLAWSGARKLSVTDFTIRKSSLPSSSSFAQFSMQFEMNGFDWLKKDLNKKVHNYFIRSASWIDTSYDTNQSLRYQQTLFDICEIYARHFRRELKDNKKKIRAGNDFVNHLNAKAMADFAHRRLQYDNETKGGTDTEKQIEWEKQIGNELAALNQYSSD